MKDALYNSSTLAKIKRSIRLIESTMTADKPTADDECKKAGKDKSVTEADADGGLSFPINIEALNAAHPGIYTTDFECETEGLDNDGNSIEMLKELLTIIHDTYPEAFDNDNLVFRTAVTSSSSYRPAMDFYLSGSFGHLMQFCYLYNNIGGDMDEEAEEMCEYLYDELISARPNVPLTVTFK